MLAADHEPVGEFARSDRAEADDGGNGRPSFAVVPPRIVLDIDDGSDGAEAVAEHEGIMAALRIRNGAALGQRLRQHLANTWRRVAPFLGPGASDAPAVRR